MRAHMEAENPGGAMASFKEVARKSGCVTWPAWSLMADICSQFTREPARCMMYYDEAARCPHL